MIRADRLTETFLWLTRFDAESYHERKIADALKEWFAAMGMTAEEDDAAEALRAEWERSHPESGRPADPSGNLLVRVPGVLPGAPVLFAAHLDTVAPGNGRKAVLHRADEERPDDEEGKEKERPHAGVREDMLTSDGTTVLGGDDGAAIAEILEAVMSLEEEKIPHRELELLFTAAEEPYCRGSRHFDFSRIRAKEAYVVDLDGPAGTASLSAPVIVSFYAEVRGRSAHAGFRPEDGIHAIAAAAAPGSAEPARADGLRVGEVRYIDGNPAMRVGPCQLCVSERDVDLGYAKRIELGGGALRIVVDDNVVIEIGLAVFAACAHEAAVNPLLGIGAAAAQAVFQRLQTRRDDEDLDRLGHALADLACALHLNIEQDIHTGALLFLDVGTGCAVAVADVFGVLQQLVLADHAVKLVPRDEKVVHTVHLAGTGVPRGG